MPSKILIVNGQAARRDRLGQYLEDQGYQVEIAENGRVASEMVEKTAYDLLLVDLLAPELDGLELIGHVHRSHPDLPQVVVSGAGERRDAIEAMSAGAYEFVVEPIEDLSELGFAVARGLERKRLTHEWARYRSLIRNFPGIVLWGTAQFMIERVHGRVEEITGYPSEAFIEHGLKWDEIVYPDDLAKVFPQAQECLIRGEPAEMEFRLRRPDGALRWVECNLLPILDEGGEVKSVFGVVLDLDITGRKQMEIELNRRLLEQESLFAIGRLVSSSLQIDEVMQLVAEYTAHLVDAASCAISDWDSDSGELMVRAKYVRLDQVGRADLINDLGESFSVSGYGAAAAALRDRKPHVIYVNDPQADSQARHLLQLHQWQGMAAIPLIVQDRVIGLAEVYLAEGDQSFNLHDLRLLQALANQVAVAIDNGRLFAAVQASEAAMRDLSLRLIQVQEQERRYLAQELHDELGQILTATKINIDLARRKLSQQAEHPRPDEEARLGERLDEASALTDKVLTDMRAMTVELRPRLLDDLGIVSTLRWYQGRFAERSGIQVQLEAQDLPARLRPEIETTIYRGVQEALTNVARHSRASQVQIRLLCLGDRVTTVVEDDGQGFDVKAWSERRSEQQTLGLAGIQERVMLLDGRVVITSQPGKGTRIEMELPARFGSEGEQ